MELEFEFEKDIKQKEECSCPLESIQKEWLNTSGSFKALDYLIQNGVILRHYIDFENFPEFTNRWVVIKDREMICKEDSFVSEAVAGALIGLTSHIEEIEGWYSATSNKISIKDSKLFVDEAKQKEEQSKKEALYGEHEIRWYLFCAKDGTPYLCANRDSGNESLYELDKNRKWKPTHNAPAFDGYDEAQRQFEQVLLSPDGKKITIR